MRNQNNQVPLATLLAFIQGSGNQQAPTLSQGMDITPFLKDSPDDIYKQMGEQADQVVGMPGSVSNVQEPYMMSLDEMMSDEPSIPGLYSVNPVRTEGTGMYDKSVPMLDRIIGMNKRMLKSGNKGYIDQWHRNQGASHTAMLNDKKMGSLGRNARDAGFTPGTAAFKDYVKKQANKSSYESSMDVPFSTSDLSKWMTQGGEPLPPGSTPRDAVNNNYKLRDGMSGDSAGKFAMLNNASLGLDYIEKLMDENDGSIDPEHIRDMTIKTFGNLFGGFGDSVANYFTGEKGQKLHNVYERGVQAITRIETGATMPPSELGNTRNRFVPQIGESEGSKLQKYEAYKYFIINAKELLRPIQGRGNMSRYEFINKGIDAAFEHVKGKPDSSGPGNGFTWD